MVRYALIACLAFIPSAVVAEQDPSALPSAQEQAALRDAEHMGALLYHHDRAAAAATDALLKVRGFKRNKSLEGWVTEARGDSIAVTFFGRSKDGENAAFYRVLVGADGTLMEKPSALKNPEPLSEFEADAAQARALALKSSFQPCAEKYNSVVLPVGDSREDWVIYLLPGTTNHRTVPIGGSYRINAN